jgi:hypothetical protein
MQITFAKHLGFAIHLAKGRRHCLSKHPAIATLSAACTGAEGERIMHDNAKANMAITGFMKTLTEELLVVWI